MSEPGPGRLAGWLTAGAGLVNGVALALVWVTIITFAATRTCSAVS